MKENYISPIAEDVILSSSHQILQGSTTNDILGEMATNELIGESFGV